MTDTFPFDVPVLADLIDIPVEKWPGNCHAIATAILHMVPVEGMKLCRGHYSGFISSKSVYTKGPQQHSWLELKDGRILDPTRWAMESPDSPDIYLGENDGYDAYGAQLNSTTPPMFGTPGEHLIPIIKRLSSKQFTGIFATSNKPDEENISAWRRLASNLHYNLKTVPENLDNAQKLYESLNEAGLKYLIQLDMWVDVMTPESVTCNPNSNRFFEVPEREPMADTEIMLKIFDRFMCIEDRPNLESELEEIGYTLQGDLWDALNNLAHYKKEGFDYIPSRLADTLSVIASEVLGKGFGKSLEVERFAKSLGWSRSDLDQKLQEFGKKASYDLSWG